MNSTNGNLALSRKDEREETFRGIPGLTGRNRIVESLQQEERRMKKTLATVTAAVLLVGSTTVFAAGIEQRQWNQQHRIHRGIRDGSLTPGEATRLSREQFRIERMERRFRADGRFTCRERARVHHRLNRSSRHIHRGRHNGRFRR